MLDNADLMNRLQTFFASIDDARDTFEALRALSQHDAQAHDQRCTDPDNCPEGQYRTVLIIVLNELVRAHGGQSLTVCEELFKESKH